MNKVLIALAVNLTVMTTAQAEYALNEQALFYRCYQHLTQNIPATNHQLLQAINQGSMKAVDACMQVLRAANLNPDTGKISNAGQTASEARRVLDTMNMVHQGFMTKRDVAAETVVDFGRNIYTNPTNYFGLALFHPQYHADSVLTASFVVRDIRETEMFHDPSGRTTGRLGHDPEKGVGSHPTRDKDFYKEGDKFGTPSWERLLFSDVGWAVGYSTYTTGDYYERYMLHRSLESQPILYWEHDFGWNFGAGMIGSPSYLLTNIAVDNTAFKADGAEHMVRNWSKSVFKDMLCRDLPAIRSEDAQSFVVNNSTVPFRTTASCVSCHVSMDQLAMGLRNFRYNDRPNGNGFVLPTAEFHRERPISPTIQNNNQPPNLNTDPLADFIASGFPRTEAAGGRYHWPSEPDSKFHRTAPTGRLFYRSYDGRLVDQTFDSPAGMGELLAQQKDFYVCVAKKYYHYFTGINTYVGDIGDPAKNVSLTAWDLKHRNKVIEIGESLAGHKDLQKAIQDILSTDTYRSSSFGQGL